MKYLQRGLNHKECQDSIVVQENRLCTILAVADGHGLDGEWVSKRLTESLSKLKVDTSMSASCIEELIKSVLYQVEMECIQKKVSGGSTIAVLSINYVKEGAYVDSISLGDTPAFISYKNESKEIFFRQLGHTDQVDDMDENVKSPILCPKVYV